MMESVKSVSCRSLESKSINDQTMMPPVPIYSFENASYRDFLNVDVGTIKRIVNCPANKRRGPRGGVIQPFPVRLHEILSVLDDPDLLNTVSWAPHGRSFIIRKPSEFANEIMPKYFKQSKLTSFQRQLNLYGFQRVTSGPDKGSFFHELFLKERPDLCSIMVRQRIKGESNCRINSDDIDSSLSNIRGLLKIDLYSIPSCPPSSVRAADSSESDKTANPILHTTTMCDTEKKSEVVFSNRTRRPVDIEDESGSSSLSSYCDPSDAEFEEALSALLATYHKAQHVITATILPRIISCSEHEVSFSSDSVLSLDDEEGSCFADDDRVIFNHSIVGMFEHDDNLSNDLDAGIFLSPKDWDIDSV